MKRIYSVLFIVTIAFSLLGCSVGPANNTSQQDEQANTANNQPIISSTATKNNGDGPYKFETIEQDFKLTIFSEKLYYEATDTIKVYAELTYIGDLDSISIGHGGAPVGWSMYDHTRDKHIHGSMTTPYIVTTLKKDEPLRFTLTGLGGYSESDKEEDKQLNKAAMSLNLLEGKYTVYALAGFQIDDANIEDEQQQAYHFNAEITFDVHP